jgi:UDP-N-acetyl-D-glucosamine dehydrogenase
MHSSALAPDGYLNAGSPATTATRTVAVVGLGYVGLPTALAMAGAGVTVLGVEASQRRIDAVRAGRVDMVEEDVRRISDALDNGRLQFVSHTELSRADAVVICVPTPIDTHFTPDLSAIRSACGAVVAHARPGQTIVLTSTSYVGCTADLLVRPLAARGLVAGEDIRVAFSPERLNPGGTESMVSASTPRLVGGVTLACTESAAQIIALTTPSVVHVASPETAEMAKLAENTFRAVNIALANELADAAVAAGLVPAHVLDAAATKPYGFMAFQPGPGVGGHCIPCDPHYLLWQSRAQRVPTPLIDQAMVSIAHRPVKVAERATAVLGGAGKPVAGAKVLLAGLAYKYGIADVRESPMLQVAALLRAQGAIVEGYDPFVPGDTVDEAGVALSNVPLPNGAVYDLVILNMPVTGPGHEWLADASLMLDTTYRSGVPSAHIL